MMKLVVNKLTKFRNIFDIIKIGISLTNVLVNLTV